MEKFYTQSPRTTKYCNTRQICCSLQARIQGGSWGSDDPPPPFSWKKNYVIDTTSLAKLPNLFLSVTSCHKKHDKLTSNAVNLSKSGAMLAKKPADRAILPRARSRLGAWSTFLRARLARGYGHAPPPLLEVLDPPLAFERFQRWHRTRWRDYLLDNKRSSIPGKGLEVPRACTLLLEVRR